MWDHRVLDRVLFPGAGFLEVGLAGGRVLGALAGPDVALVECAVPMPLVLPPGGKGVILEWRAQGGAQHFDIASASSQPHMRARVTELASSASLARPARCGSGGVEFTWRMTNKQTRSGTGAIDVPRCDAHLGYHTHPASLDNAMQLAAACKTSTRSKLKVPAGIKAYGAPQAFAHHTSLRGVCQATGSAAHALSEFF